MAELRLFDQSSLKPRLEQAFDFVARQVALRSSTPDYFPIYTVGGAVAPRRALDGIARGDPRPSGSRRK